MAIECSISGCGAPIKSRGWCKKHYTRWLRHGDPQSAQAHHGSFPENLLSRTEQGPDGCVLFTGNVNGDGYGILSRNNKTVSAHRAAYEHFVGPIPDGMTLDHECHNRDAACEGGLTCLHRRCVNPEHLTPKVMGENVLASDRSTSGRNARKTHCIHGHEFTPENTYVPPKRPDRRYCRSCAARRSSARRG